MWIKTRDVTCFSVQRQFSHDVHQLGANGVHVYSDNRLRIHEYCRNLTDILALVLWASTLAIYTFGIGLWYEGAGRRIKSAHVSALINSARRAFRGFRRHDRLSGNLAIESNQSWKHGEEAVHLRKETSGSVCINLLSVSKSRRLYDKCVQHRRNYQSKDLFS